MCPQSVPDLTVIIHSPLACRGVSESQWGEKRKFPARVSYITCPGHIDGFDGRKKAGLRGKGPEFVFSNLAVLGFDEESKRMKLISLHPGVTLDEVKANTGFELIIPRHIPTTEPPTVEEKIEGHVVIVGYGRVGRHIINLLEQIKIPSLVIDSDAERVDELSRRGIPTLYGDASNSEILTHAGLDHARALVVAGPDESSSGLVVAAARDLAPDLPIIPRATTEEGIKHLTQLGAQDVIHPELEGGLEIVWHPLLNLGFPLHEIMQYVDAVRNDHYDTQINTEEEHRLLHDLINASGNIEVTWMRLEEGNPIIGQTLAEANLRAHTGASVVAIMRNRQLMANPKSSTPAAATRPSTPWTNGRPSLRILTRALLAR